MSESGTTNPDDTISSTLEIVGNLAVSEGGLTKREYFSAMALQGIISNSNNDYVVMDDELGDAVKYADYLIEELNKQIT